MENDDDKIKQLIAGANQVRFDSAQKIQADITKENLLKNSIKKAPKKKKTKALKGKLSRHQFRKAKGIKAGFGKNVGNDTILFRAEFNWLNAETEEESNEQVHWIECTNFKGRQYKFYRDLFDKTEKWLPKETVESKFITRYACNWLILNREKEHLNQCFIYSPSIKKDETIRELVSQIVWTGEIEDYQIDVDLAIVLKQNVWHTW